MENKMGAPEFPYSDELAQEICKVISSTPYSLKHICSQNPHFPKPTTIYKWRIEYPNFAKMYADAKVNQAETMADYTMEISDNGSNDWMETRKDDAGMEGYKQNGEVVARSRLRADTRKWLASKLAPRLYGDGKELIDARAENEKLQKELEELRAKLLKQNEQEY